MAVTLFGAFVIFIVPVVSLNLEPPEFLGPYTDDPARWPYGGCVQVSRIYPAPGSLLLPPLDPYAKDWNLTITVVFSRPVTRILWNYDIRVWLRNVALSNDSEVLSCAKQACLIIVHNGMHSHQKAITAGATERGNVFSDEYQFTFTIPTYVKDHMSEVYFALDGGWMYSPVYKFIGNPDVEYVPYVAVRYLPPRGYPSAASNRLPERDRNYWVNYPSTCAAHGGLIHRPFIFSQTKRRQQLVTAGSPKLLTELTEVIGSSKGQRKLKLYYQIKQRGNHTVELPGSIKLVDKETKLNVSFSVPAVKSLVIDFTSPRLYIPVKETKYTYDYRERAYYQPPRWNAYFFTLKDESSEACRNNATFDCNMFQYSQVFPNPLLYSDRVTIKPLSGGYRLTDVQSFDRLELLLYHQFILPEDKQFYHKIPQHLFNEYEYYSKFLDCYAAYDEPIYCYTEGWNDYAQKITSRNLTALVLDPYWKLIGIYDKYSGGALEHFIICNELPRTIYKSEGISVPPNVPGMLQLSGTGSLYERKMNEAIPLIKFYVFYSQFRSNRKRMRFICQGNFKRNVGKWGILRTYIEYENMYRLHVPQPPTNWTIQQTMNVKSNDKNGHQHTLNATIVSYPEHIKEAVERYAVLTNVEPSVFTQAQRDTRLRAPKESYPLEKAVFVPRELIYQRGCGTMNITEDNIIRHRDPLVPDEFYCDKTPDDCTGLPFDSLDRFPLIPPFNVLDLIGPVDLMDASKKRYRRALYYRDDIVNDLFILYSPNSYYTGVVEISGVEVKEPEFVEKSCDDLWQFSPDRYEVTKGHLTATITNKGEGGGDVLLTVHCTPKLGVFPEEVTVWVDPHQTTTVRFVLGGYPKEVKENSIVVYKCNVSITIDVTPFSSAVGKTFPSCDLFIPTFDGYFVNPCDNHADHDITYYHLPTEFVHHFSLEDIFLSYSAGREYELLKIISIKLVKYHMIRLSCDNKDVLALPEDHLITASMNITPTGKDIDLVYSIDKLLQEKVYIFMRKGSDQDAETRCLLTLISTPFTPCRVVTRKYITLTKADIPVAIALQKEEEAAKKLTAAVTKTEKASWYRSISDRDEVLSAILVCIVTSLILIVLIATGNSALLLYDNQSRPEKKIEQVKAEIQHAKQEHEESWNNPRMYLRSGVLGPHYVLQKFKATDALDTANLKMLKLSGVLRYREKELQVVVEYIDKVTIKKPRDGNKPDEVWLKASSGMYLLKQNYVSEEYKEEFDSFLQRYMGRDTREY